MSKRHTDLAIVSESLLSANKTNWPQTINMTMASDRATHLQNALDQAISKYQERNPRSKTLHEKALASLPGGNTRTVLHTDPFPVYLKSGDGFKVVSEDGQV
jgi:glutamate-1-semialdehyde 2,1-aminomutase